MLFSGSGHVKIPIFLVINFFCLMVIRESQGYIQELTFYEDEDESGNYFVFRNAVPDMSAHSSIALGRVKRYCVHGGWNLYTDTDYDGTCWYKHYPQRTCMNIDNPWGLNSQSFRHFGSSDTKVNALTMYTTLFAKEPRLITQPAAANLDFPTYGLIGQSGPGAWTLFQGSDFDGPSACIPGTGKNGTAIYHVVWAFPQLDVVGSIVQGCFSSDNDPELAQIRLQYHQQG